MSIQSEITRINNNIAAAYTACDEKGAILPETQNSANLANCISSISTGGSSPVISSLTVTPLTSQQTITVSSGTDGYNPIIVNAVTSSIDANIIAGNIKSGVNILGVTGTYEGSGGGSENDLVSLINFSVYTDGGLGSMGSLYEGEYSSPPSDYSSSQFYVQRSASSFITINSTQYSIFLWKIKPNVKYTLFTGISVFVTYININTDTISQYNLDSAGHGSIN